VLGSKRSFQLWTPSPVIEPLNILSRAVTGSISIGFN
jgi:hypothetical protein